MKDYRDGHCDAGRLYDVLWQQKGQKQNSNVPLFEVTVVAMLELVGTPYPQCTGETRKCEGWTDGKSKSPARPGACAGHGPVISLVCFLSFSQGPHVLASLSSGLQLVFPYGGRLEVGEELGASFGQQPQQDCIFSRSLFQSLPLRYCLAPSSQGADPLRVQPQQRSPAPGQDSILPPPSLRASLQGLQQLPCLYLCCLTNPCLFLRRHTSVSPIPCTKFPLFEILRIVSIFCLHPDLYTKADELVQIRANDGRRQRGEPGRFDTQVDVGIKERRAERWFPR